MCDELMDLQNVSVIRDYSKGSDATTYLCTDGSNVFFRKNATGRSAVKLRHQIEWIESYKNDIPLSKILSKNISPDTCSYDMEVNIHSVGLFEYAHSVSADAAWNILDKVLNTLEATLYNRNKSEADEEKISQYINEKVTKKLAIIRASDSLSSVVSYDTLTINGKAYRNLPLLLEMLSKEHLQKVFKSDPCSVIHGDLTFENILCTRDDSGVDGYYLIDPNTNNIHETKFIDYAKVMQSIHGNYEFVRKATDVNITANEVTLNIPQSSVYEELLERFLKKIHNRFEDAHVESIYYHEIVNWLRLMNYKIQKNDNVIAYYASMIIVMNDVYDKYYGGKS